MVKQFVVKNFNLVLVLSIILGLILPGLEYLPKSSALILISTAIFFSCSKVSIDELRHIKIRPAILFYMVRFLLIPIPVFFISRYFVPDYAMGILLVTLAPVGASSTAVAILTKSNPSLALSATVITNVMAPFIMPLYIYYLDGNNVDISISDLFITLSLSIFLPSIFYFGAVRRVSKLKKWVANEAQFMSTLCIGAMMAVVTALEKDYILNNLSEVVFLVVIGSVLFVILYAVAWIYGFRMSSVERKTYMICSGVNNTGISTGIALLYFSPATILFSIVVEIPWIIGLIVFKKYAEKYHE